MLKIISGGQTGADQAAWRAAKACGIPTGGWMPKGCKTEDGLHWEFVELYGAQPTLNMSYSERTRLNVAQSDAMLWFDWTGFLDSPGAKLTLSTARGLGRPYKVIDHKAGFGPERLMAWLRYNLLHHNTINVAGNRESRAPGIGDWVEEYLRETFWFLGHKPL